MGSRALGVGFLATAAVGIIIMATIAGDLHAALRAHPCSGSCVEADGNERTRACVANTTCAPSNATCAAVGCRRNQPLLTPANCVGVEVRASDGWMSSPPITRAAPSRSSRSVASARWRRLAKTIGVVRDVMTADSCSAQAGRREPAARWPLAARWEVDPSGVCVCRSSNS